MLPAGQHWAKDLAERLAGRPDPLPSASWPWRRLQPHPSRPAGPGWCSPAGL